MAETHKIGFNEEALEILDRLRLLDDDFMTMVFDGNTHATELILNIILERDDMGVIKVERQEVQKEMKNPTIGGRGIRLDIYAKDSKGRNYDIEIQQSDSGADVHRARFNSAMLDARMLRAGQDFSEINESYVIFIAANDTVGAGLPIYHADRTFRETGEDFGDGNHIVYVNGSYDGDSPIGRLMHDFRSRRADDMYYKELADQVRFYKETEKGRDIMCRIIEEYGEKKSEEARLDTLSNTLRNIMETLDMSVEQGLNAMKVPDADRAALVNRLQAPSGKPTIG